MADERTYDGVDPELIAAIQAMPSVEFNAETLPIVRAGFAAMGEAMPGRAEAEGLVKLAQAKTRDGYDLPLRVHAPVAPRTGKMPALLSIHGGGFVIGDAALGDQISRLRADAAGCVVISVDYRLAPEHPHDIPVEDCYAALEWIHAQADALGVDRARIGVTGDSAGGGLAAGLTLLARDRGGPKIAFQHLIYPMLDDRTCLRRDVPAHVGVHMWNQASNRFGWTSLLGRPPGGEGISPYAAPARADSLAGLPPAFIYVGALDLFVDEDIAYAQRLMRAGVPTELHVYPGAYHGFEIAPDAAVTRQAARDSLDALRRACK
jgi:acetyl esterase/lipase